MSRLAYFDCSAGASGDMILGALLDLGLPLDALRAELAKLAVEGYELRSETVKRAGLRATKIHVLVGGQEEAAHDHAHGQDHEHGHEHTHGRRLADIVRLIEGSGLEPAVRERSARLFRRLGEAEARAHGTKPDEVHLHEVGAVDSIVDIVGCVWGLTRLGVDRFVSSPLNVGGGAARMSHGTYPVPTPATAMLLEGVPIWGEGEVERVTPTGALLITGHATEWGPLPALRLVEVGHGAGTRDTASRPNVLRLLIGEESALAGDRVVVLEAELDDASPQILGALLERLFESGVKDAYLTPVQMKKSRPGVLVTVLTAPGDHERALELLFSETTTLGVRTRESERATLEREVVSVSTPYGPVGVKVGRRGSRVYNAQPEFEDCRRAAQTAGVPVKEVLAAAIAAYRSEQKS